MGTTHGARPPSHQAYFVALGGVLLLLLMLLSYCFYFCVRRIKELATQPMPPPVKSVRPPPPAAYPVQPVVRESATAMARLCKQIPPTHTDTVFPTLSPNKPSMMATPPRSPGRSVSSPGRSSAHAISPSRSPAYAGSPARSPAYATYPARSPARSPAHAVSPSRAQMARSPGSRPMPLPPPKIISHSPAKKRPNSMPDQPTPAISVSEVK